MLKINDETKSILRQIFTSERIDWNDGHTTDGIYFECFGISGITLKTLKTLSELFGSDDIEIDFCDYHGYEWSMDISVGNPTKGVEQFSPVDPLARGKAVEV